jgi:hypothetical protein
MTRDKMPTVVIAGAIVVGAMILAGVPLASLFFPLVLLACPLMMIFMMRGMDHGSGQGGHGAGCHGGHTGHTGHQPTDEYDRQEDPSTRSGTDSRR